MRNTHKDFEFSTKDYEYNFYNSKNNNYQEFSKTQEINNNYCKNSNTKNKKSSSKLLNIIKATALTAVTATITVVTIINVSFTVDVNVANATYSSLSFQLDKSNSNTLQATLLDSRNDIVSTQTIAENLLTFNDLIPSSKYILEINYDNKLIYQNEFYTLDSPLVKLDNYSSDDENLYFTIENSNNIPLTATLESTNYHETRQITSNSFYFSNLESLKDYNLKIYENSNLIYSNTYSTKGSLIINDIYFERLNDGSLNLCFDNPYSYPVELCLYSISSSASIPLYQVTSDKGKYQLTNYKHQKFRAVFTFNQKTFLDTTIQTPFSLVETEIGSSYLKYVINPNENNISYTNFYEIQLNTPSEFSIFENDDGNIELKILYLNPNTSYRIDFGYYLENNEFETIFSENITTINIPAKLDIEINNLSFGSVNFKTNYIYKDDIIIDIYEKNNDELLTQSYFNEEENVFEVENLQPETSYIGKVRINNDWNYLTESEVTTISAPTNYVVHEISREGDSITLGINNDDNLLFIVSLYETDLNRLVYIQTCDTNEITFSEIQVSTFAESINFRADFALENIVVVSYEFTLEGGNL